MLTIHRLVQVNQQPTSANSNCLIVSWTSVLVGFHLLQSSALICMAYSNQQALLLWQNFRLFQGLNVEPAIGTGQSDFSEIETDGLRWCCFGSSRQEPVKKERPVSLEVRYGFLENVALPFHEQTAVMVYQFSTVQNMFLTHACM